MIDIRSYSIEDLEALTGVNQRTISYYIQQGLLPKVGRRGRSTRYPQLFVDRLKFIQRVRDLQDSGRLGSTTLPRIARIIWHLVDKAGDAAEFPEVDDLEIQRLFENEAIPDERILGETSEGEPVTVSFGKFGPYVRAGGATASIEAQEFNAISLDEALARIDEKQTEKERRLIQEFDDLEIQVLDGPYGPYVTRRGINAKIPKNLDPTRLTSEECLDLINEKRAKLREKKASRRRERLSERIESSVRDSGPLEYAGKMSELTVMLDESVSFSRASTKPLIRPRSMAMMDLPESPMPGTDRLIREIERQVRNARGRAEGRTETWTRAPITENIEITVKGVDPEHAELVDSLAQRIRELLGVD